MQVRGEIRSSENFLLDGRFEGNLHSEGLVCVGRTGEVNGDIVAENVLIEGAIIGNVTARDRVELKVTGRIQGDIRAPRVKIAEGCTFQGRLITAPHDKPLPDTDPSPEPGKN
jgi:cytoskeletal protein CcmA (bactofilin family)